MQTLFFHGHLEEGRLYHVMRDGFSGPVALSRSLFEDFQVYQLLCRVAGEGGLGGGGGVVVEDARWEKEGFA